MFKRIYLFYKKLKAETEPAVFFTSAGLIAVFVVVALLNQASLDAFFSGIQTFISNYFGWLYIIAVNVILIFCIYLGFGKYRNIRIGGKDSKPEFSTFAWLAMLFNAGIGLVLMFYSIAEPILHYSNPPYGEPHSVESAKLGMQISFLHWGIHGWAVYALMGLSISYFAYNRGLPLGIRWILYPLLGDRLKGPLGHAIDIMAVVATLFGLATTLGLGIQHINSGLGTLFGLSQGPRIQVALIMIITFVATASVVSGLHRGIQNLSKIAAWMAIILMIFMLIVGPTLFIVNSFIQNTGGYFQRLIALGTWTEVYIGNDWMHSWTIFYWAWWFAWSPFVGLFIARISKGRTLKDFMLGVMLGPTFAVITWISIFGSTALHVELFGEGGIAAAVNENIASAIYMLLEKMPLSGISVFFVVIAAVIFFVTSSDSGSLVIDYISTGGNENPPVGQRIFWAMLEGIVASVLLLGGGLIALQTGSLVSGLPVCILLLLACWSMYKALKKEIRTRHFSASSPEMDGDGKKPEKRPAGPEMEPEEKK